MAFRLPVSRGLAFFASPTEHEPGYGLTMIRRARRRIRHSEKDFPFTDQILKMQPVGDVNASLHDSIKKTTFSLFAVVVLYISHITTYQLGADNQ